MATVKISQENEDMLVFCLSPLRYILSSHHLSNESVVDFCLIPDYSEKPCYALLSLTPGFPLFLSTLYLTVRSIILNT